MFVLNVLDYIEHIAYQLIAGFVVIHLLKAKLILYEHTKVNSSTS